MSLTIARSSFAMFESPMNMARLSIVGMSIFARRSSALSLACGYGFHTMVVFSRTGSVDSPRSQKTTITNSFILRRATTVLAHNGSYVGGMERFITRPITIVRSDVFSDFESSNHGKHYNRVL